MFFKLLTAVIILLAGAWMLARGRAALPRGDGARARAAAPPADDLVSCGRCGIWLPAGQRCDCAGPAPVDGA